MIDSVKQVFIQRDDASEREADERVGVLKENVYDAITEGASYL